MKAAFLDFATVGSDELDDTPLRRLTDEFEIYDNTATEDIVSRIDGVEFVYINKIRMTREIIEGAKSLKFIDGTELDYETNLLKAGFRFNNPKAQRSCSCGESFSV